MSVAMVTPLACLLSSWTACLCGNQGHLILSFGLKKNHFLHELMSQLEMQLNEVLVVVSSLVTGTLMITKWDYLIFFQPHRLLIFHRNVGWIKWI